MTLPDRSHWQQRASQLDLRTQAFIDGRHVDAFDGQTFACISPVDGRELAQIARCGSEDIDRAVRAARAAFDGGRWSESTPVQRKHCLLRLADLIESHADELALLETLDMGKPIRDSVLVDLPSALRCLRWTAEAIDKVFDEIAPTGRHELGLITREPLGVIGAIVPWNFPLLMAMWKIAPALATGNSVVLKPSEKSPLTALRIAELAIEAGLPPGVFNVVPGFGAEAGEPLALHMDVDGLVFTGSTAVGKHLLQCAGRSNMKRAFMECGGKSPNLVFADAPDLKAAAEAAASGIFFNQGEVCTAASRLLVETPVFDEFMALVRSAAGRMTPGDPLDPRTRMGAMVDAMQTKRVMGFIDAGRREGATLTLGGEQVRSDSGGFYIEPTVFERVSPQMSIAREEIFGPVLSAIAFDSAAEAISIANDSDYGLAAAVWTSNLSRAHKTAQKLRAGSVWVNCYDGGDMTAPFGGFKQSGNGRDKSLHAFEKYTELKATWIHLG